MKYSFILSLLLFLVSSSISKSQQVSWEKWFWSNPGLPRNAQSPLFQDSLSLRPFENKQALPVAPRINQHLSAQYQLPTDSLATESSSFTLEFWLLQHINQPIGFEVFLGKTSLLGHWNEKWQLKSQAVNQQFWEEYFTHLVLTLENGRLTVWENGKQISQEQLFTEKGKLLLQSYLQQEPQMSLDHWVKHLSYFDEALTEKQIEQRFQNHQNWKNKGLRFPDTFHFLTEPYLFPLKNTGMQITFELDRQSQVSVSYGTSLPLTNSMPLQAKTENLYVAQLQDLHPGTAYFYQLLAQDPSGKILNSGPLTFRTAPSTDQPIVFGVVSDTEARPQINEKIGSLLWDERVDFTIHLGDLTDGGQKKQKWQWTQEFFPGSSALYSRIPNLPVAGNGEGDLHWFNYYHPQSEEKGYYSVSYGLGDFFILNSNQPKELQVGGNQYQWLQKALQTSTAPWKIVLMHHAPYSADEDDYGNTWKGPSTYGDRRFQDLVSLLEKEGVKVFFFGHLHTYMRSFPIWKDQVNTSKGITYFQLGGMGGNLEDFAPNRVPFSAKTYRGHHYGTVTLTKEVFELRTYTLEGNLIDYHQLPYRTPEEKK
jgi:acid phosphatase type 7